MVDDKTEFRVLFRTEYFQQSVEQFRESVEELCRAAEELEAASISYDDPVTGKPKSLDFTDLFDLEISIKIEPNESDT